MFLCLLQEGGNPSGFAAAFNYRMVRPMKKLSLMIWTIAFLGLTLALGAGVGWISYSTALTRLAEQGRADLALATDRLTLQLLRYRELAVVLTSHPDLNAPLTGMGDRVTEDRLVQSMADKTGALSVDLVDRTGRVLASSSPAPHSISPTDLPLSRAIAGSVGTEHGIVQNPEGHYIRAFSFAAPIYSSAGPSAGAVMTSADVSGIEDNWPANTPAAYFTDAYGVVFISNRSELRLTRIGEGGDFPAHAVSRTAGFEIWHIDGGPYLPRRALHVQRDAPTIGLSANVLIDAGPAAQGALLAASATIALVLVFGAGLLIAVQQRQTLSGRLKMEAAVNAQLEARVSNRTRALAGANEDLRREIVERKEAEAALKHAQNELVKASKLSALGEMSAGISHELNQPLMAIRSFAENGIRFMERDQPDKAGENLGRIAELARRMGRIIQNLRAFARQESGPVTAVDIVAVIEAALEVTAEKLALQKVALNWTPPTHPLMVYGGEVRLEQVMVNLISNAIDAMAEADVDRPRQVDIETETHGEYVLIAVRDTGPGLAEPDRVFDPFYTTKAVGAAEGMGLGLSISYGLVQSFGGTIRCANHPEGGAVFTVELKAVQEERA